MNIKLDNSNHEKQEKIETNNEKRANLGKRYAFHNIERKNNSNKTKYELNFKLFVNKKRS